MLLSFSFVFTENNEAQRLAFLGLAGVFINNERQDYKLLNNISNKSNEELYKQNTGADPGISERGGCTLPK